ncbi:YcxB family protein [Pseudoramibacter sp.]|jgi:hypothetical protein|uniref:YcxB family protein n=1 Tax=Pseudoramibacter sp. TaxID=2034862 RepID=UPI0025E7089A|nr:YcxB family protein [Pseudoramibacter sp.]MCH4072705.1 YcxB family protein [Pseudoramibacter sp.]MCH4106476.1 YcxB family protein [Pseudoramibacter sp.]
MNPLYEIEEILTEDEFYKSCQAISAKKIKRLQMIYLIIGSVFCLCGILFIVSPVFSLLEGLIIAVMGVIFSAVLCFNVTHQAQKKMEKTWQEHSELHNMDIHITFFEDHLTQTTPTASQNANYSDLSSVIETETNFYLMTSPSEGSIIVKDRCSSGLIAFLQDIKEAANLKNH